ncbi:MAG TPA: hypothetical protein VHS33_08845 [Sphingomicrobium sp.]|jgi:hypothetical protein|nr:hypothetical protein [Sphingomicrobium sp.]
MHFHLPKPLHGWRELAGEVGIIVLGVLIALGAEQAIETIHWHGQVTEFRQAVDAELADDWAAYQYRINEEPCVKRRIGELQQWLAAERAGKAVLPAGEIGRPSTYIFRMSVWKSSSPDIMNHLSMRIRERYASIYDLASLVNQQISDENDAWRGLNAFDGQAELAPEDLREIGALVYRAKSIDRSLTANYSFFERAAGALRIRPDFGERKTDIQPPDPEFCRPLFPGRRAL